jgi:hypothetical protein
LYAGKQSHAHIHRASPLKRKKKKHGGRDETGTKARPGNARRESKTSQNKTKQDQSRPDKTITRCFQDQLKKDKTITRKSHEDHKRG